MKKITILIPAYNEESNLRPLLKELTDFCNEKSTILINENENQSSDCPISWTFDPLHFEWEFLFVNDGSRDNTLELLYELQKEDSRINIVNLSRNFGKENAMLAGMDFATGDALIIMDADLQDPVNIIPEMIYWWTQGYQDVYGKRSHRGKEPWLRKKLSLLYYNILQKTTKIEILPNVGDFRLIDRQMLEALKSLRETQRYTKGLFCWVGFKKKEVLFNREDRAEGKSSFRFSTLFNLAIEGITSFTTAPLRFSTLLGFIVSNMSLCFMLYIFTKTIIFGDPVQGFPALMCVILFLGGVQLIAIGIIGEYIGRIFNETKMRPPYIIESYDKNSSINIKVDK